MKIKTAKATIALDTLPLISFRNIEASEKEENKRTPLKEVSGLVEM